MYSLIQSELPQRQAGSAGRVSFCILVQTRRTTTNCSRSISGCRPSPSWQHSPIFLPTPVLYWQTPAVVWITLLPHCPRRSPTFSSTSLNSPSTVLTKKSLQNLGQGTLSPPVPYKTDISVFLLTDLSKHWNILLHVIWNGLELPWGRDHTHSTWVYPRPVSNYLHTWPWAL